ncbi:MAG: hypothetical protein AMXMBFR33_27750 [Candidatus Xenobia bacterium]
MSIRAVIPVNRLEQAKSRLAEVLSDRSELVLELLSRVVQAIKPCVDEVLIVSPDRRLEPEAARLGVSFLLQRSSGLNPALDEARAHLGEGPLLVALGDLPQLTEPDVRAFLLRPEEVLLAPDREQNGTNLMFLRSTGSFMFQYGPGSFVRHFSQAMGRGLTVGVHRSSGTEVDLDAPTDLPQLAWTSCD